MNVDEALQCLGTSRVIWIDDEFNEKPADTAKMLKQHLSVARACHVPETELREIIDNADEFFDTFEEDLSTYFMNNEAVAKRVQSEFLQRLAKVESSQEDLTEGSIDQVCRLLKVDRKDRLSFTGVENKLPEICKDSADETVLYIVDLNDAVSGNSDRGLEVLYKLFQLNSRGTAFLLTHESGTEGEATKEADLRTRLKALRGDGSDLSIPTCVIAKERILGHADESIVEDALKTALKRAGLRRSIHEVLWKAQGRLQASFAEAAKSLTSITPESLEDYVVEKGFREGLSELHVVERALTAHMSRDIRLLFGTDPLLISSAERMRSLRGIELRTPRVPVEEVLERFRRAEVWEGPELINASLSPISCGDVFEIHLPGTPDASSLKFILLGQACDVALRSNGKRDQETAIFMPLKVKAAASAETDAEDEVGLKKYPLPFLLDRIQYVCDFRSATSVRLGILDLASFRKDGLVQVEEADVASPNLLPGQAKVYTTRTKPAQQYLQPATKKKVSPQALAAGAAADPKLLLTFDTDKAFRPVARGELKEASQVGEGEGVIILSKRITWSLRRCGRIRMPYAAAILEAYVNVMSRRAFDMEYMGHSHPSTPVPSVAEA